MERAAEELWSGGCSACRKLESAQMRLGKRLLGENQYSSRSSSAERSRLEERREEMKVL